MTTTPVPDTTATGTWEQIAFDAIRHEPSELRVAACWGFLSRAVESGQPIEQLQAIGRGLEKGRAW